MTFQTDESQAASLNSLESAADRLRSEIARRGDAAPAWLHQQLERLERSIEDRHAGPDGTDDNYEGQAIAYPWYAWALLLCAALAVVAVVGHRVGAL